MIREILYSFIRKISREKRLVVAIPYFWLLLFFFVPVLLVLKISFSQTSTQIPPFSHLIDISEKAIVTVRLNIGNYLTILSDYFYIKSFISSLTMALIATIGCLMIGYTMAYSMTRISPSKRNIVLLLVILPFWTSFLIRVYAWIGLLSKEGFINSLLLSFSLISVPLKLLYSDFAVCLGIIYCYLPFMILPIYATLEKLDQVYLEAAYDLGCKPWKAFWKVTLPLSKSGIIAGCILVFIPAVGEFVIPELLGGPDTLMIGRVLWIEFFNNRDWPLACSLAVVMLILFVVPIMIFQRLQLQQTLKEP